MIEDCIGLACWHARKFHLTNNEMILTSCYFVLASKVREYEALQSQCQPQAYFYFMCTI
jgi:hypothetical protein